MSVLKRIASQRDLIEKINSQTIDLLQEVFIDLNMHFGKDEIEIEERKIFCTQEDGNLDYFQRLFIEDDVVFAEACVEDCGDEYSAPITELTTDQAIDILEYLAETFKDQLK